MCEAVEKGWLFGWEKKNFKDKKNPDLRKRFLVIYRKHHIKFHWVKGHAGHVENERCDELAFAALMGDNLLEDAAYNPKELVNEDDQDSTEGRLIKGAKVEKEGDPCRKCNTATIKKATKKKEAKPGQTYYYEYYLYCSGCTTMYLVDEAKRELGSQTEGLFS